MSFPISTAFARRLRSHAVGVISGLTLEHDFDSLCRLYYRTAVAIALASGISSITLNANGYVIDTLHVTGGHTKNPLLMELYADATGCTVVVRTRTRPSLPERR